MPPPHSSSPSPAAFIAGNLLCGTDLRDARGTRQGPAVGKLGATYLRQGLDAAQGRRFSSVRVGVGAAARLGAGARGIYWLLPCAKQQGLAARARALGDARCRANNE